MEVGAEKNQYQDRRREDGDRINQSEDSTTERRVLKWLREREKT